MTSEPRTMNARLQAQPQPHYGVNGGAARSSRPSCPTVPWSPQRDDALQFLTKEEKECIQFFEKTIDSLEDGLEETDRRPGQVKTPARSGPIGPSLLARPPSPKDQDIIYLVRPEPDLGQNKEPVFNPTNPDFRSMMQNPESHFETRPRRDQVDGLPSEYNPPLPSGSYGSTDSHHYHPPGCIPTPVLIAQQIAENQAGGTSNFPSSKLLRRSSQESDKPLSYSGDFKHGSATSVKPTHFPANINVIHGNKEHQNQPLANMKLNDRRAQMLANLTGTPNPLQQENPQPAVEQEPRNTPARKISFKDPSPDKSRMEALSKLGLTRNPSMSEGTSHLAVPNSTPLDPPAGAETSVKPLEASAPPTTETNSKLPKANVMTPTQSLIHVTRRETQEILRTESLKRYEDRNHQLSTSAPPVPQNSYHPPPSNRKASLPPSAEVTSLESNSYGGKSITVNPSVSHRNEPETLSTNHEPKVLPPAMAKPSEFNNYGGKTKVMTPVPAAVTRSDLPDILSSHINKSQPLPAKSEPLPTELNSYGGKSRTFNPTTGLNRTSDNPGRSFKAPAPTTAPKPSRQSYHGAGTTQKPALRAPSPEPRRRSSSMFRPQGITVQFSGRGATDESRRDALRKLGLLKDS
ncbi:serine/arginine repetitive matrix protein 1 isoform X1 [Etheostoma cragini]|uniref:serine/arginine repetitive matrix protein 1 isoform X1 n=1 Tax=Etheostoma cragini TaxID=417921 RepID=UPI00155DF997|nr:serine/arginine repetitive matrix protein 1 isoform X1 [Etheostoma cragini]